MCVCVCVDSLSRLMCTTVLIVNQVRLLLFVEFNIPFIFSFNSPFLSANRTTCATCITDNSTSMYIDVFTSSKDDVEYNVTVEPVKNFSLQYVENG